MRFRTVSALLAAVAANSPSALAAQTMITFEMPIDLTNVSLDIEKVFLSCTIKSLPIAFPGETQGQVGRSDELPVLGGQLKSTMRVVFAFPEGTLRDPLRKSAEYVCALYAVQKSTGVTGAFSETATNAAFLLKPTPPEIRGTFTW